MKINFLLNSLCLALFAGMLVSCLGMDKNDRPSITVPEVENFEVKDGGTLVYELKATVDKNAIGRIVSCGFYYGKNKDMSDAEKIECKLLGRTFAADLTLREYDATFYICSYISNGLGKSEICSEPKELTVKSFGDYVSIDSPVVMNYDKTSAEIQISYVAEQGVEVSEYGVCYGKSEDLDVDGNIVKAVSGKAVIKGLTVGESYYMCAYLMDGEYVTYGNPVMLAVYGVPEVKTEPDPFTESYTAVLCGEILSTSGLEIDECGFLWCAGIVKTFAIDKDTKIKSVLNGARFSSSLNGLVPNCTYSFCAYAVNAEGVAYGKIVRFTTGLALPDLDAPKVGDITSSSALLTGAILNDGGDTPSETGFYYSQSDDCDPKTSSKLSATIAGKAFSAKVSGLLRATTYYVRAYAVNSAGESVSDVFSFETKADPPEVETSDVTDITGRSAVCGGMILDDGGSEIIAKGIVWSDSPDPVKGDGNFSVGDGNDTFVSYITGLLPNTVYYVRAYAENSTEVSYGESKSFKTKITLAEFEKLTRISYTSSSLYIRAYLSDFGGDTLSETGFYYSQSDDCDPKTSSKLSATITGNTFRATVSGLLRATTYYVRAYAVNSAGESVSDVFSFETRADRPVVETSDVTDITGRSAVCGGMILDDGGSEIIAKGIVWSTSSAPTTSLTTQTSISGGADSFQCEITGLLPGTQYYVRAYARNSAGTSYGTERSFITDKEETMPSEAANCFIVSKSGAYAFRTVKGNSTVSVGAVKSAEVLWESFGTSTIPKVGDLVKSVSYSNGIITFQTADTFREGNAVIAAKDSAGKILWSWHIWFTDEPTGQVYFNNAGTMMDRNLGATSATPGDVGALGLLYQWGRKDPFLSSSSISGNVEAKSTITWPSPVKSSATTGTFSYVVGHPTTFINYGDSNFDWYYSATSSVSDNTRWQSKKTIYDPCPAGWRVPDGGSNGVWAKALGSSSSFTYSYDSAEKGMNFSGKLGGASTIWYPASGCRHDDEGSLQSVGSDCYYWSVTPNGVAVYDFRYEGSYYGSSFTSINVTPSFDIAHRAFGQSVRCFKE